MKNKWLLPVIVTVFVLGLAIVDANIGDAVHFAKGSKVDGIDVSNMTYIEANSALESGLNETMLVDEVLGEQVLNTKFKYGNAVQLHTWLVLSHIDPRTLFGYDKNYTVGLKVMSGIDATSSEILNLIPSTEDEIQTSNAYIDYNEMKVIPEVQGNNLNYVAIANAIADQRKSAPTKKDFVLERTNFYVQPSIVAADLEEECKWASEHLVRGIDVQNPDGVVIHLGPAQMATIVNYNGGDISYNEEAAMNMADTMAGDEIPDKLKVNTVNGVKELLNYVLPRGVDREQSAASIIEAAKASVEGKDPIVAQIYINEERSIDLPDHVEVSTEQQKLWLVQDGKITLESPVVTGMHWAHDTPHGIFKVAYKLSPMTLRGNNDDGSEYASYVDYWMPFNGGIGMHDAMWRSSFGGKIYIGDGSHGCVNCPHETARILYKTVDSGYIVVVY